MVWHDDKTVELETISQSEAIECIQNDALDDISLEEVQIIHGFCRDKIEMLRGKVRFPSHCFLM
jgi:hypothetical protein